MYCTVWDQRATRLSRACQAQSTIKIRIFETPLGDGLSHSSQNLCHVRCSHWQGLRFCIGPGICMRFDNIKFLLQFYIRKFLQTGFSIDHPEFCTVFLQFYQNSVDFLKKKFTGNLLCTTTTYPEKPEGATSQER